MTNELYKVGDCIKIQLFGNGSKLTAMGRIISIQNDLVTYKLLWHWAGLHLLPTMAIRNFYLSDIDEKINQYQKIDEKEIALLVL